MSRIAESERAGAVWSDGDDLELAGAVDAIRVQLSQAMAHAEGQRLQFELGDIELEFAVAITHEAKIDGGVKVWVINAGASEATTANATHRVKVTLKPKDMHSGQSPAISDRLDSIPPR
jgi:hypothetical protein